MDSLLRCLGLCLLLAVGALSLLWGLALLLVAPAAALLLFLAMAASWGLVALILREGRLQTERLLSPPTHR